MSTSCRCLCEKGTEGQLKRFKHRWCMRARAQNSTISNTIVDKNARIGKNCSIVNAAGVDEAVREDEGPSTFAPASCACCATPRSPTAPRSDVGGYRSAAQLGHHILSATPDVIWKAEG